ncbi:MAG: tRNA(Glu)-specific nuclease WapA precursor [Syntrophorhabdus sp. PtaB.Bin027]|nr:MAG: tRNA(Glu)-specific nuclease WapA precursor [Syntrophorhabdus sp. PtaB.Bin027]
MENEIYYVRDGEGNVIAEYDGLGNLIAEYVYGNNQRLARINSDKTIDNSLNDHPAGAGQVPGSAGTMVSSGWSANYAEGIPFWDYPFGEIASQTGSAEDTRFDFTGQERDQGTGLMYFGARYYDPEIGRWMSVDPLGEIDFSMSPYNYCHDNPLTGIDLHGCADISLIIKGSINTLSGVLGLYISTRYYSRMGAGGSLASGSNIFPYKFSSYLMLSEFSIMFGITQIGVGINYNKGDHPLDRSILESALIEAGVNKIVAEVVILIIMAWETGMNAHDIMSRFAIEMSDLQLILKSIKVTGHTDKIIHDFLKDCEEKQKKEKENGSTDEKKQKKKRSSPLDERWWDVSNREMI